MNSMFELIVAEKMLKIYQHTWHLLHFAGQLGTLPRNVKKKAKAFSKLDLLNIVGLLQLMTEAAIRKIKEGLTFYRYSQIFGKILPHFDMHQVSVT